MPATGANGAWRLFLPGRPVYLFDQGILNASIHHVVEGSHAVRWGSGLIYAAIHQLGGTIVPKAAKALVFTGADGSLVFAQKVTIPARPYLGVSAANAAQMERLALSFIGSQLGAA